MKFRAVIVIFLGLFNTQYSVASEKEAFIDNYCGKKWSSNGQVRAQCKKRQHKAHHDTLRKSEYIDASLVSECQKKWKSNFELVNYCIKKEFYGTDKAGK